MKCIVLIEPLFCCRHHSQSERCRVPAISSNGYTTDYWRWGDPGTYETVLGGEPGWETRLPRDKEDHAQSSRQQRHVSCQLNYMWFAKHFVSASFQALDGPCLIFWPNSFFDLQRSLKQTPTENYCFLFLTTNSYSIILTPDLSNAWLHKHIPGLMKHFTLTSKGRFYFAWLCRNKRQMKMKYHLFVKEVVLKHTQICRPLLLSWNWEPCKSAISLMERGHCNSYGHDCCKSCLDCCSFTKCPIFVVHSTGKQTSLIT